jgi:succinate dehydrogenase / fumarate reductase, membrane anchor subunit
MSGKVTLKANYEARAWKWMRYSALLLIPLAWGHMVWQDLIVGVHKIDLNYVALRWASTTWRAYDFFLLAFAFAHGVNGLRQVMMDFVRTDKWRAFWSWALLLFWLAITIIGAGAIIGGVRMPKP